MASQMTIVKKLVGSFGASIALTLVVGGTSLWLISDLGASLKKTVNSTAHKQLLAAENLDDKRWPLLCSFGSGLQSLSLIHTGVWTGSGDAAGAQPGRTRAARSRRAARHCRPLRRRFRERCSAARSTVTSARR